MKYSIGPTYLYTKVGYKRKQYQGQKRKKIIYLKGNSQTKEIQILVLNRGGRLGHKEEVEGHDGITRGETLAKSSGLGSFPLG